MRNVRQIWEETVKSLQKVYDRTESENISYVLLEDLFHITKAQVMLGEQLEFDQDQLSRSISKLLEHRPVQYVTSVAHFYNRKFHVAPGVLIPRPETEELVDLILRENAARKPKVLDVGVGSGCIAISLEQETNGEIYGTDVSREALNVAEMNAKALESGVTFIKHNVLLEPFPVAELDILVSNPPYIPEADKAMMHANVLDYEPGVALFVDDDDPLIFYRTVAQQGVYALKVGGRLYFEIHERFGSQVQALLDSFGYTDIEIHQDMQGKDRMVSATNSANT